MSVREMREGQRDAEQRERVPEMVLDRGVIDREQLRDSRALSACAPNAPSATAVAPANAARTRNSFSASSSPFYALRALLAVAALVDLALARAFVAFSHPRL